MFGRYRAGLFLPKLYNFCLLLFLLKHFWNPSFPSTLMNMVKTAAHPCWTKFQVCHHTQLSPLFLSVQFSSIAQSCPTLCDPTNRSTPGLPVQHQLPEFTQTHVHRVSDAIQPSHPLSSPSPPALNLSQHQGPFQRVISSQSGGQSIGVSASASVLPVNTQD